GCRGEERQGNTARSPARPIARIIKRAGSISVTRFPGKKEPDLFTRSTGRQWPSVGPFSPSWKTINRPTDRLSYRKSFDQLWAKTELTNLTDIGRSYQR